MSAAKLGWKAGMRGLVLGAPPGLDFGFADAVQGVPDIILAFAPDAATLAAKADTAIAAYERGKRLWFAYPKKSGRLRSDIDRDRGWEPVMRHDLLPVSQVALGADWSALRFRYRDEIAKLTRRFA
jgi:hypothetical protein